MSETIEITPGIHWIGVNDRTTDLFEGMWPISGDGVSYNSYLIRDEKPAVIDLAKAIKGEDLLRRINSLVDAGGDRIHRPQPHGTGPHRSDQADRGRRAAGGFCVHRKSARPSAILLRHHRADPRRARRRDDPARDPYPHVLRNPARALAGNDDDLGHAGADFIFLRRLRRIRRAGRRDLRRRIRIGRILRARSRALFRRHRREVRPHGPARNRQGLHPAD